MDGNSDQALTKNDLWKLQFLATSEAKVASTLLNKCATPPSPQRPAPPLISPYLGTPHARL